MMLIIRNNKNDFFEGTFSKKRKSTNPIIHWWQKITNNNSRASSSGNTIATTTTSTIAPTKRKQDWRNLSPHRPPLPFLSSFPSATKGNRSVSNNQSSCNTVQSSINFFDKISETNALASELTPIFKVLLIAVTYIYSGGVILHY